jgi:rhodanese-related sulfurtransferase
VDADLPISAIDRLVEEVRSRISVVTPETAYRLQSDGALLVDTRPEWQRRKFGGLPGAVTIERNHLEWRLDPTSHFRHPSAVGHVGPIVVVCQEGYSSVLAVGTLQELGVPDVHDLAGGFDAWVAAGLPTEFSR